MIDLLSILISVILSFSSMGDFLIFFCLWFSLLLSDRWRQHVWDQLGFEKKHRQFHIKHKSLLRTSLHVVCMYILTTCRWYELLVKIYSAYYLWVTSLSCWMLLLKLLLKNLNDEAGDILYSLKVFFVKNFYFKNLTISNRKNISFIFILKKCLVFMWD